MKKSLIIAFAVLVAGVTACEIDGYEPTRVDNYVFSIVNNTADTLVWFVPEHGDVACDEVTGDLPVELTPELKNYFFYVGPLRQTAFSVTNQPPFCPLEEYHPNDTVTFYFFSPKTLRENEWSEIVEQKLWLAKYSYTAQQVIDMNKLITYPAR